MRLRQRLGRVVWIELRHERFWMAVNCSKIFLDIHLSLFLGEEFGRPSVDRFDRELDGKS